MYSESSVKFNPIPVIDDKVGRPQINPSFPVNMNKRFKSKKNYPHK